SCRMPSSDSFVDRSASVSSMRRISVPSLPRASSQLKSAVRALPTCSWPVGLGANRSLISYPRGFARRTPLHALSLAASPAPPDRVAHSLSLVRRRGSRRFAPLPSSSLAAPDQRDGVRRDRLAAADRIPTLVGFSLDADARRGAGQR